MRIELSNRAIVPLNIRVMLEVSFDNLFAPYNTQVIVRASKFLMNSDPWLSYLQKFVFNGM